MHHGRGTIVVFLLIALVGGHGPMTRNAKGDLAFTREYLTCLRETMGEAAAALDDFDDAYRRTDGSRYSRPAR